MCGIAGIFAADPEAPPARGAELTAMNEAMRPRGPDGAGEWMDDDGRLAFAHRRLAIIDLTDAGAQPMATPDGRLVITYNGEIYNFMALRDELESQGVEFRTRSDTEVLLHLYRRDGANMVHKLRGMFAFALWDADRQGLLLARDPYGIKPLYYADDGKTLRFASQVKALRAGGAVGHGVDPAGHVGFFLLGYVPEPHTLYADIRALPAGHTLWLDRAGGRETNQYADVTRFFAEARDGLPEDLAGQVLDSVRHHLVSDVPVGVFLSAGMDSTTLAALAAQCRDERGGRDGNGGGEVRTFTLGFEEFKGTQWDEVPLAEAVAKHYGTSHTTRWVKGTHFQAELDHLLAAMDQPSIDGANTYFVAREAAESGLKVALSGLGGDELLGGYDTFSMVPRVVSALGWVPFGRGLGAALRVVSRPVVDMVTSPKYAGLLEYGGDYAGAYLLRRGVFMPWELPGLLDGDVVRDGWRALEPRLRLDHDQRGIARPAQKVGALETAWYMRNQLLRDSDWAGMAHSLEIRVPLVDPVLGRALAPYLGGADRGGGVLSKRALPLTPAKPLPDAILNRPKTGFAVPVQDWVGGAATDSRATARGYRPWLRHVYAAFARDLSVVV